MSLRRLTGLCCVLVVLTAVILARVYWVGTDTTYAASAGRQATQTTELPRARGNFLVDIEFDDSRLTSATITSLSGLPCTILYDGHSLSFPTTQGTSYN